MYRKYIDLRDEMSAWTAACTVISLQVSEYNELTDKNKMDLFLTVDEFIQELAKNIQFRRDIIGMLVEASSLNDNDLIPFVCTPTVFAFITNYLNENMFSSDEDIMNIIVSLFASPSLVKFLYTVAFEPNAHKISDTSILETYLTYAKRFAYHDMKVVDNIIAFLEDSGDIYVDALSEIIDDPTQDVKKVIKRFY